MPKKRRLFVFVFSILILQINAQDSTQAKYKLGFFDLTGGLDTRLNVANPGKDIVTFDPVTSRTDTQLIILPEKRTSFYQGVFFRMQTSFLGSYYKQKFKRLVLGDLISGEVSAGYSNTSLPNMKTGLQILYNFEFGFFGTYRISESTDIGMSFSILKFSKDYLSDLDSGSDYYFRIRHKRCLMELGYISKNKLYFGVFNFVDKGNNQDKLSIGLKYFIKPYKIMGARIEMAPVTGKLYISKEEEVVYSFKLFYGINF